MLTRKGWRRAAVAVLLTLGSATAAVGLAAVPASASYPVCTGYQWRQGFSPWGLVTVKVPVSYAGSIDCVLYYGVVNEGVRTLQESLAYCHGRPISVDGDFGPQTDQAMADVQWLLGIYNDGVYGPASRNAISFYGGSGVCGMLIT